MATAPQRAVRFRNPGHVATVAALAAAAAISGLLAGRYVVQGAPATAVVLAAALAPIAIFKRPALGPMALLLAALLIEQSRFQVGTSDPALTDRIPFFHGTSHGNEADLLIAFVAFVWFVRQRRVRAAEPVQVLPNMRLPVAALVGAVFLGLLVGASHHGDLRIAMTEIRPYLYLAAAYALASALLDRRRAVRAVLWTIVVANGIKALQALWIFFTTARDLNPRPEAVLGHEESLFFGISVLIPLALWMFGVKGRLRTWSTALVPAILLADLVNSRRTAWLIIGAGVIVLGVIVMAVLPDRRRVVGRLWLVGALVAAVYLPVYWNRTGAIGQPARAIHSAISPDPRDGLSNLYRIQENANLQLNIKEGGLLGRGFGVPIDYALPIADIRSIDPLITYIPHNGVFYMFMRMGLAGGIAFWCVLGFGIIAACRLARSPDREHAALGAVVACTLIGYALMGYNDQGFYFFRIAIVVGTLLGLVEATRRLDASSERSHGRWPAKVTP
jgi:hypothetical protein